MFLGSRFLQVAILSASFLTYESLVFAKPHGGEVIVGQATISKGGQNTEIVAKSDKTVLHWKDFSIAKDEQVNFQLPSASSAALNRVVGQHISKIDGKLISNGSVYLLNPNGLLVGKEGSIDTLSFIGSTFDVLNSDFLNGENFRFFGDFDGKIVNLGTIRTSNGDAILIGREIENHGTLEACGGIAAIIPHHGVVYQPKKDQPIFIKAEGDFNASQDPYSQAFHLDRETNEALEISKEGHDVYIGSGPTKAYVTGVVKSGFSNQEGGSVLIMGDLIRLDEDYSIETSQLLGGGEIVIGCGKPGQERFDTHTIQAWIGSEGLIQANAIEAGVGGNVLIWGDHETSFYGKIEAGTEQGSGGFVEVSSPGNLVYQGPVIGAKQLLLDPNDITIRDNGGTSTPAYTPPAPTYTGAGTASAVLDRGQLQTTLGGGTSVTVSNDPATLPPGVGNITVEDTVTWSADSSLTLNGYLNVNVNAAVTSSSAAATGGGIFISAMNGNININADMETNGTTAGSGVTLSAPAGAINQAISGITIQTRGAGADISVTANGNITLGSSVLNLDTTTGADVTVISALGDIQVGDQANGARAVVGNNIGTVIVEATRGSVSLFGGNVSNAPAVIGFWDTVGTTSSSGPITVRAGTDMTLRGGTDNQSLAMITRVGNVARNVTNNDIVVTVGNDLLVRSGDGIDGPGAGIGRPEQITAGPVVHQGDITVNVGRDCRIYGGDTFSGIGVRGNSSLGSSMETNIRLNVGRNFIIGHGPGFAGRSGAFIGGFRIPFFPTVSTGFRNSLYVNVGNNLLMDGRFGSASGSLTNDNQGSVPAEMFIHVGGDLMMFGGPLITGAVVSSVFDYVDTPDSSSHFWAGGNIYCVNGTASGAHLHFPSTLAANGSINLGTINARATGDVRVAGGMLGRLGITATEYRASGGFSYEADTSFAAGELWGPQTALVGGSNVFAGTPLGFNSPAIASNGVGGIAFDTNEYDTQSMPGTEAMAIGGANLINPTLVSVGNTMTYQAQEGSDILMLTTDQFQTGGGGPADILNIGTTGPSIVFDNSVSPQFTNPGRDITIIAFRDTVISGDPGLAPAINAPAGNILVITNNDMTLQDNARVSAEVNVDLVCDNQAPSPPQIGPGGFFMDDTSQISSNTGYTFIQRGKHKT
ncbi:filamentous hemagglutinin N-terminal domain-containing protein [Simkania sp.]|uniref:two-partner secretion domain-containing protein n=1 Tax=Simkania sp. TaxID=34094 RepID=UPI003B52197D